MIMKLILTQWQQFFNVSVLFFLLVPIISYAEPATVSTTISATIVKFSEYEQGTGTNSVTMTVTDNYLRIDDSIAQTENDNGFVLYDRNENVIYSISSEEQQVVKIKQVPVTIASPIELKLHSVRLAEDKSAPLIKGKKTQHYQIFVNDKLCYNMISVPGLMPDVVMAMSNFNQLLAGQQAETLRYIPADLHEACDLARHTFYPQKHFEYGFPLLFQAIDETGQIENIKYSRALINFKKQKVSAELFVLPNYSIVPVN